MILPVISSYRLVRSGKDLWAGAGWGMGWSPRRAGESLSRACCTRHGPRTAHSLSFSGAPVLSLSAALVRQSLGAGGHVMRSSPVRAETSPRAGEKGDGSGRAVERGPERSEGGVITTAAAVIATAVISKAAAEKKYQQNNY
jgi:hypothetical protein